MCYIYIYVLYIYVCYIYIYRYIYIPMSLTVGTARDKASQMILLEENVTFGKQHFQICKIIMRYSY